MKTLIFCLQIALIGVSSVYLSSCSSTPAASNSDHTEASDESTNTNSDANIATVQKFIDAQMIGDGATMRLLVNNGFLARNPAGDTLTIEKYVALWEDISKVRSDQDAGVFATNSQQVTNGPLKGSWVLFWGTYTALDIQKQEPLEVLWHADFLLENGKISRSVSYFDMADPDDTV